MNSTVEDAGKKKQKGIIFFLLPTGCRQRIRSRKTLLKTISQDLHAKKRMYERKQLNVPKEL